MVEVELTVTRLVIVLVAALTNNPPPPFGKMVRLSVLVAHLELRVPVTQVMEPTAPEVMFKQPLASVSMRSCEVLATPETVSAVVEALVKWKKPVE